MLGYIQLSILFKKNSIVVLRFWSWNRGARETCFSYLMPPILAWPNPNQPHLERVSPLSRVEEWNQELPWRQWARKELSGWRSSRPSVCGSLWWMWCPSRARDSTRTPPRFWWQERREKRNVHWFELQKFTLGSTNKKNEKKKLVIWRKRCNWLALQGCRNWLLLKKINKVIKIFLWLSKNIDRKESAKKEESLIQRNKRQDQHTIYIHDFTSQYTSHQFCFFNEILGAPIGLFKWWHKECKKQNMIFYAEQAWEK